jgi:hypothetical protein
VCTLDGSWFAFRAHQSAESFAGSSHHPFVSSSRASGYTSRLFFTMSVMFYPTILYWNGFFDIWRRPAARTHFFPQACCIKQLRTAALGAHPASATLRLAAVLCPLQGVVSLSVIYHHLPVPSVWRRPARAHIFLRSTPTLD